MGQAVAPASRRLPVRGLELAVRDWPGDGQQSPSGGAQQLLLVHGLASNAKTWDGVAERLSSFGHHVVAVDQRGHGLSDKPDDAYGFDEVSADLRALIDALDFERPIVFGQSWGGNVVLDFAARYPDATSGIVLVDGGFIELASTPDATWEQIEVDLRPPPLAGTPRTDMLARMKNYHAGWSDAQIEMQMGNFETMPDGTIRPWLTLDRHMQILRALWEQRPAEIYPRVQTPTLIAVADAPMGRRSNKEAEIARAEAGLSNARVRWFADTAHDIHVDRPLALADWVLEALDEGFFG